MLKFGLWWWIHQKRKLKKPYYYIYNCVKMWNRNCLSLLSKRRHTCGVGKFTQLKWQWMHIRSAEIEDKVPKKIIIERRKKWKKKSKIWCCVHIFVLKEYLQTNLFYCCVISLEKSAKCLKKEEKTFICSIVLQWQSIEQSVQNYM